MEDAYSIEALSSQDIIVTCQGGDYTSKVYEELRKNGWNGYWIDAASSLRMADDSIIVLDPVNRNVVNSGLAKGVKNYIGGAVLGEMSVSYYLYKKIFLINEIPSEKYIRYAFEVKLMKPEIINGDLSKINSSLRGLN